ncbi:NAD(P)-dependent oxidoreductase [Breoghania sp.]|uniref:NAD(P)-dependent oxidoreductase n=1 Tax=Breoghania sp. TaxID=2065378 RepID=UPI0029C9F3FD|nr:NAD(P)-dependent oxidoreductase [Breoghania sp.]
MRKAPILLIGGSGTVGRRTAQSLREANPDQPLLIGGRDLAKAEAVAAELGHAEAVAIDLAADDLGVGERPLAAIALFFKDDTLTALRYALSRGVPYMSISSGIHEVGPELATQMYQPKAAPVVFGAEWLVGATTIPILHAAKDLARVDSINIAGLIDEQDFGGPATLRDIERLMYTKPAVLTVQDGAYVWLGQGEGAGQFHAIDGTPVEAESYSPYDLLTLSVETGADNIRFLLAAGETSSRRRGDPLSTEIIYEITGDGQDGSRQSFRQAVFHPRGQMPLTALGTAMVLERLAGLSGGEPVSAGLYFPSQLIDHDVYMTRFATIGGEILPLPASAPAA